MAMAIALEVLFRLLTIQDLFGFPKGREPGLYPLTRAVS